MFWIIFTIVWSYPGFDFALENKKNNTLGIYPKFTDGAQKIESIMEILSTFSWPLGYGFIFLSKYPVWIELGLLAIIHFIILPFAQAIISTHIIKKEIQKRVILPKRDE